MKFFNIIAIVAVILLQTHVPALARDATGAIGMEISDKTSVFVHLEIDFNGSSFIGYEAKASINSGGPSDLDETVSNEFFVGIRVESFSLIQRMHITNVIIDNSIYRDVLNTYMETSFRVYSR